MYYIGHFRIALNELKSVALNIGLLRVVFRTEIQLVSFSCILKYISIILDMGTTYIGYLTYSSFTDCSTSFFCKVIS